MTPEARHQFFLKRQQRALGSLVSIERLLDGAFSPYQRYAFEGLLILQSLDISTDPRQRQQLLQQFDRLCCLVEECFGLDAEASDSAFHLEKYLFEESERRSDSWPFEIALQGKVEKLMRLPVVDGHYQNWVATFESEAIEPSGLEAFTRFYVALVIAVQTMEELINSVVVKDQRCIYVTVNFAAVRSTFEEALKVADWLNQFDNFESDSEQEKRKRCTKDEANNACLELMAEFPETIWTLTGMAKKIGCSPETLNKTRAWRNAEKKKSPRPKAVRLTDSLYATLSGADDQLGSEVTIERLIAEQQADAKSDHFARRPMI
ncbi:hypothetical protein [Rhodopirellula baltica]